MVASGSRTRGVSHTGAGGPNDTRGASKAACHLGWSLAVGFPVLEFITWDGNPPSKIVYFELYPHPDFFQRCIFGALLFNHAMEAIWRPSGFFFHGPQTSETFAAHGCPRSLPMSSSQMQILLSSAVFATALMFTSLFDVG